MIYLRSFWALALVGLLTSAAWAAEPLQPSGQWKVDFGDAHCIATRSYGPASMPILLALKPSPIGDVMQLSVLRRNPSKVVNQFAGTITVDQMPPMKVSMLGYATAAGQTRVNMTNLPLASYQPIRTASTLRVNASTGVDATFALSGMRPVTRALDECIVGLRNIWHIGEARTSITRPARVLKPLRQLFGTDDYPSVAQSNDMGGTVTFAVMINEAGKVASCMVTATSGYASLDAQACAIITARARFDPALGLDGKPTKSAQSAKIRWEMP